MLFNTPVLNPIRALYRKAQKLMYRGAISVDDGLKNATIELFSGDKTKAKEFRHGLKNVILNVVTGKGTKTFYIGGTDKYFNDNFIPDVDDFALKSSNPVKVCKTKIGATVEAIKNEGLSGIKQNKCRAIVGALLAVGLFALSAKLIKYGLNELGVTKDNGAKDKIQ